MSIYFDGSGDYAGYGGSLGSTTGHPLTLACWVYRTNLTAANQTVMAYGDGGGSDNHSVYLRTSATAQAQATTRNASSAVSATTTETAMASAWHHYAGVFSATNSRIAYLDGASASQSTEQGALNAFDEFVVGKNLASTLVFAGYLGHVAVWKSALSAGQIASLAAGANPQAIDAANLVAYYPMTNSGAAGEDIIGGYDLTLYGDAAYDANNPAVNAYGTTTPRLMLMGIG